MERTAQQLYEGDRVEKVGRWETKHMEETAEITYLSTHDDPHMTIKTFTYKEERYMNEYDER